MKNNLQKIHQELMAIRRAGENRTLRQHLEFSYPEYYPTNPALGLEKLLTEMKVNPATMRISQIIDMAEGDQSYHWLWYELLLSALHVSITEFDFADDLLAASSSLGKEATVTQPYIITTGMRTTKNKPVPKGGSFEKLNFTVSSKIVQPEKFGKMLEIPYETLEFAMIDVIGTFLKGFGLVVMSDRLDRIIDVMLNGDNGRDQDEAEIDDSAAVIGVLDKANGITYKDILRVCTRLWRLGRPVEDMIADEDTLIDVLNLEEYKKRELGTSLSTLDIRGKIRVPTRAYPHDAIGAGRVLLFCKPLTVIEKVSQGLMIENEKDILRQLEKSVISFRAAHIKVWRNACVILDGNYDTTEKPWPAWMGVVKPVGA